MLLLLVTVAFAGAFGGVGAHKDTNCAPGRHTIVHLFEWKWTDIADECERFLGPYGFCGVQVSPVNEHRVVTEPFRPWWERYQPVSYKLESRSGSEYEFSNMVQRCNAVNVRVYVDAVINHMVGVHLDGRAKSGYGIANSYYNSGSLEFPGVPFSALDFNGRSECPTDSLNIESYNDPVQVRNCRLVGADDCLVDLQTGKDYVQSKIVDFLNSLVDIGVAGIRLDAAKHMWPSHVKDILGKMKDLRADVFGSGKRPFVYQEVIDNGGEAISSTEYTSFARVTEFKYGAHLARAFNKHYPLRNLHDFGEHWGMIPSNDALVFVDNHDNQRGHGGGGNILTFRQDKRYKAATAFALAHPYGFTRIMSSYNWDQWIEHGHDKNDWVGPPAHADGSTKSVPINDDMTCGDRWVCEHRWRQIYSMVRFRNVVAGTDIGHWWDNGAYQIAFSRGDRGFVAFTLGGDINADIPTGLPYGNYCDVISGAKVGGACSGKTVTVSGGRARVQLAESDYDAVIAIHQDSRL